MINEIMKPTGPAAELGLQRVQEARRPGGPDPTEGPSTAKTMSGVAAQQGNLGVDSQKATQLAEELTQMVQQVNRQLQFKVDGDTGKMVIQVLDGDTHEMVRQIPAEEIVALQRRLAELQESGSSADGSGIGSVLFNSQA